MKLTITIVSLILFAVSFINCSGTSADEELTELKNWMTGSFNSKLQSETDTNFFNIHLEMVEIWEDDKDDQFWLYVEQAASWALDKPYRQRVYRVKKIGENKFESAVFSINNPLRFAGDYKIENPLTSITPDSLVERAGCAIILEKIDLSYIGSTVEKNCTSNLRGASYATSEVKIQNDVLTSWDRGFNENDEQVWGAVTGPYIFRKQSAVN